MVRIETQQVIGLEQPFDRVVVRQIGKPELNRGYLRKPPSTVRHQLSQTAQSRQMSREIDRAPVARRKDAADLVDIADPIPAFHRAVGRH
jgi:hypothetical protein